MCVQRYKGFMDCEFCEIFLSIVGILGFYDFVIFLSRYNTLILLSCTLCFQE